MLYIYVLGIVMVKATQRLVTTLKSQGGLGHHDTGYYSIFFRTIIFLIISSLIRVIITQDQGHYMLFLLFSRVIYMY